MKNSELIVETKKGKEKFNILLKIEDDDTFYVIYTKNEKNKSGDTIAYAATYMDEDGIQSLKPIERDDILEYLDSILLHIESNMINKESGN